MDVAPVKVGVPGIDEAGLFRQQQGAFDRLQLATVGDVDLGGDAFEEGVGRLVALFQFVADLLDVLGDALFQRGHFRQRLHRGPLVAAEELEHFLHLRDGLTELVFLRQEGVGVPLRLADFLHRLRGELAEFGDFL